ncbi:helix-turn-helix domain-containing protein [Janibacter limosus]|uniref:helix-turn-helix domain-containing protein n=1 Tax=Janibacter limosus TaxID=53458 RepID=UPI0009FD9FD1|nr:helix-turn-helix transcriptional regulator [Janibacter limosus]
MSKNPLDALPGKLGNNLGDYLREQRLTKKLSVRQLSAIAGISNPYLSQIERGVKRPSAEILQQIAKGLSISAETLYVQAGLLDPKESVPETSATTRAAIASDPALTSRQRQTMLEIYESFVGTAAPAAPKRAATKSAATKTTAKKKSAGSTKSSAASSSSKSTSARAGRGATTSSSTSTTPRRTP